MHSILSLSFAYYRYVVISEGPERAEVSGPVQLRCGQCGGIQRKNLRDDSALEVSGRFRQGLCGGRRIGRRIW